MRLKARWGSPALFLAGALVAAMVAAAQGDSLLGEWRATTGGMDAPITIVMTLATGGKFQQVLTSSPVPGAKPMETIESGTYTSAGPNLYKFVVQDYAPKCPPGARTQVGCLSQKPPDFGAILQLQSGTQLLWQDAGTGSKLVFARVK